jgi:hypothetical protein
LLPFHELKIYERRTIAFPGTDRNHAREARWNGSKALHEDFHDLATGIPIGHNAIDSANGIVRRSLLRNSDEPINERRDDLRALLGRPYLFVEEEGRHEIALEHPRMCGLL